MLWMFQVAEFLSRDVTECQQIDISSGADSDVELLPTKPDPLWVEEREKRISGGAKHPRVIAKCYGDSDEEVIPFTSACRYILPSYDAVFGIHDIEPLSV